MMTKKRKKLLLWAIIPSALFVFFVFTPRVRVSHELSRIIEAGLRLDISSKDVKIIDYHGRWSGMYAKLELSMDKYDQVKQRFLLNAGTASNKDFEDEIISEESKYRYDFKYFSSQLSFMNSVKHSGGFQSMNLDDYEEMLIMGTLYGAWFTTGGTEYVLVKENSGNCYLYVWSGI